MIGRASTRVAVATVAIAIAFGSLTGCARGALATQQDPAPGVVASTATPSPTAGNDDSLQSIQGDLDSADSATTNAGGDVSDADSSAATSDSP